MEWVKHVDVVHQHLNSSFNRSIGKTPELLIRTSMKLKDDMKLRELIGKEIIENYEKQRNLREEAKEKLFKIQKENRKTYNKKRRKAKSYWVTQ